MKIEVDERKLKAVLLAYIWEQDWGDYAGELQQFCRDVLNRNEDLKKWSEEETKKDER